MKDTEIVALFRREMMNEIFHSSADDELEKPTHSSGQECGTACIRNHQSEQRKAIVRATMERIALVAAIAIILLYRR